MNRRTGRIWKYITVIMILILILFQYENYKKNQEEELFMGMKVISQNEYEQLLSEKEISNEKISLLYNGVQIAYDGVSNKYYIPQDMNADGWNGEISALNETIFFVEDDAVKNKQSAIKEEYAFRIVACSLNQICEMDIVFTGMPTINIVTESMDGVEVYGKLSVINPYDTFEIADEMNCSFHERGGTSREFPKKNYKLNLYSAGKTPYKTSLLGMREDDDWILNALYSDSSKVREKLSVDIWNMISESNSEVNEIGTKLEYVEVFLDGVYQGLYGLMEPIDKKQLSLQEEDVLYKVSMWVYPSSEQLQASAFISDLGSVEIKYPKILKGEEWLPLQSYIGRYWENNENIKADVTCTANISNVVDNWLFNQIVWHGDGGIKNEFLVASCDENGSYEMIMIPWDFNLTFGDGWNGESPTNSKYSKNKYKKLKIDHEPMWDYYSIYNQDTLLVKTVERWEELKTLGITEENLKNRAKELTEYIDSSGALARDTRIWPLCENTGDLKEINSYISGRMEYLEKTLYQLREAN